MSKDSTRPESAEETALAVNRMASSRNIQYPMYQAGQTANEHAACSAFADYRSRKAANTLRHQDAALALFARYLAQATGGDVPTGETMASDPDAWRGATWGLVEGFVRWLLLQGYAVETVNVRLSTIKTYAKLAAKSGALDAQALAMIRMVSGYGRKEGKRVDERRGAARIPTRVGEKKASAVVITPAQAGALKNQPDTPQGRRDKLILCLLLDHGLRVSEVAGLAVSDVDIEMGMLHFYRPKVDMDQIHRLTADTLQAARAYLEHDALPSGPLLRRSFRGGKLGEARMSTRAISGRVRCLGERLGIDGLSAHDLRHYWATQAARNGTPIDRLQDAGGWASPAMPLRYVEATRIANEGVKLGGCPRGGRESGF